MVSEERQPLASSMASTRDEHRSPDSSSTSTTSPEFSLAVAAAVAAAPQIESAEVQAAGPADEKITLKVKGANFRPGAVVLWNGRQCPTRYQSTTELRAEITSADLATSGEAEITVRNPRGQPSKPARLQTNQ
jgi:hypothetical protein